jgi:transcriptional regulator with XRE-family HTH domain
MLKTAHSALSRIFCEHIRSLRKRANMTQRDLAIALGREHGLVARIELGERRVDFAEAYQIFVALGTNPGNEADSLMTKFATSVVEFPKMDARCAQRAVTCGLRAVYLCPIM